MKKIFLTSILFALLAITTGAHAYTLDDAKKQIASIKTEISNIRKNLTAQAIGTPGYWETDTPLEQQIPTEAPRITVLSPNGGESYTEGQKVLVRWETVGIPKDSRVGFDLYWENALGKGKGLANVAGSVEFANDGEEVLVLPIVTPYNILKFGKYYKITAMSLVVNATDQSDSFFSIQSLGTPKVTILSPNGAESFVEGQLITVKWNTENIAPNTKVGFDLYSSKNSSIGLTIANTDGSYEFVNDGEETLVIPSIKNNFTNSWEYGNYFKLSMMVDSPYDAITDQSDGFFAITVPTKLPPITAECTIEYFAADPTKVSETDTALLSWSSSCKNVSLSGSLFSPDVARLRVATIRTTPEDKPVIYTLSGSSNPGCLSTKYSTTTGKPCTYVQETARVSIAYIYIPGRPAPEGEAQSGCTANTMFNQATGERCEGVQNVEEAPLTMLVSPVVTSSQPSLSRHVFIKRLRMGSKGDDVSKLQLFLKQEGVFDAVTTGYYGPITLQAVQKLQVKYGLEPVGVVGPKTLELLNK